MLRTPSPVLRASLVALLLAPSLAPVRAAAQVVNAAAVSGGSAVAAAAGVGVRGTLSIGAMPLLAPSLSIQHLTVVANFVPVLAPSALSAAPAAASLAVPALEAIPSAHAAAAPAVVLAGSGNSAAALTGVFRSNKNTAAAPSAAITETRMNVLFDGAGTLRGAEDSAPVAASLSSLNAAATLEKSSPASAVAKAAPPAAVAAAPRSRAFSFAKTALIAAALLLAFPAVAMAAPAAGPAITSAASLSYLAGIQPLAAAAGAVLGAIFGMFAARAKDGSVTSAGEVFASILRYGVLGGAGVYVLLDVTHLAFAGAASSPLQPITTAIATAALGRTAFQDKFTDPATTSADRITGAFPAVAAAVGISLAAVMGAFAAPALSVTLATTAMTGTGVATALFAALFKPGQSPAGGPARMAKGYVLQALMMGLALAMTNHILFAIFAAMGTFGFGLVLWATALEIWAHRPGAPAQPLPPAPPLKPATPPVAPAPAPKV